MKAQTIKKEYVCQECAAIFIKWNGQCQDCKAWNSIIEQVAKDQKQKISSGYSGSAINQIVSINDIELAKEYRISSGMTEFDRVLGGGIVDGSIVMIGGDPGIGKSTLLLQILSLYTQNRAALYITGEESLQQIAMRAKRLNLQCKGLDLITETDIEKIIQIALDYKPNLIVIDSIQTVFTNLVSSAPGSVSQLRESTAQLVKLAKQNNVALFLIGHVTKDGSLAGPRVLEHMVDTVLYFEGQKDNRFRIIRAVKNRFGAVNELGIFAMTENGLQAVSNPSAIFLSQFDASVPGSSAMVTWEGSRPMMVEIQSLVDQSHSGNPRRVAIGIDHNRLTICLAVLHRHGGIVTYDQDVFINVVGGIRITEPAADLSMVVSIVSSIKNKALPKDLMVFGELGLAGEIRPVQGGVERIKEAHKHGFKQAIVPKANMRGIKKTDMNIRGCEKLEEVLSILDELDT